MIEAGFHSTWDGVPADARQTWRGGGRFKPTTLDYIFTKGISPLRARILMADGSDHLPLEISVPISELQDWNVFLKQQVFTKLPPNRFLKCPI